MRIIKRITGWVLLLNIIPVLFVIMTIINGDVAKYGYLIPLLAGYLMDAIIAVVILLAFIVFWLLQSD